MAQALGTGQFVKSTYMAWDKDGAVYSGDSSVGRVTKDGTVF